MSFDGEDPKSLESLLPEEEVFSFLSSLCGDKAFRPDGFSIDFW